MGLNFNRVELRSGEVLRSLSAAQFFALPLTERLRAIFEKRLAFYRDSELIETGLALQSMRQDAAFRGERR
ncbi:MAG: hypothetical protein JWN48_622 [Myxococcaceae bacterium]|nr:hypothetical protein [Myxococcaceae bacterium]